MIDEGFENVAETQTSTENFAASKSTDSAQKVGESADRINEIYDSSLRDLDGTTVSLAEVSSFLEATVSARKLDAQERIGRGDTPRELIEQYKERTQRLEAIRVGLLTSRLSRSQYDELRGFAEGTADALRDRGLNPQGLENFVKSASGFIRE